MTSLKNTESKNSKEIQCEGRAVREKAGKVWSGMGLITEKEERKGKE